MQTFIVNYGYLAIFVLMLAESTCIPVPSELTMLFWGALAGGVQLWEWIGDDGATASSY